MNILVVGGGGREHAIIYKLRENRNIKEIFCLPGNGGIAKLATCVPIRAEDVDGVVSFAEENKIDFAIVGPDDPLSLGMVDRLTEIGIPTFGPDKKAAEIESSKVFAKKLMKEHNIPTADYLVFESPIEALNHLENGPFPTVVKADGLALGKGVVVAKNFEEARLAVDDIMINKIFGASGDKIIIEDFLTGPEVSILTITDGKTIIPLISSMDHKRINDNDEGKNTGGMGAVAPNPYYTPEIAERCMKEIFLPTIKAMSQAGRPFKGCLYFGLMLTDDGPHVIEYNCRFGDPEAQVVLPLLDTDLFTILEAAVSEKLDNVEVKFKKAASCCVVASSGGYPSTFQTGYDIFGLFKDREDAIIFHSGTRKDGNSFVTAGGRVIGITTIASDMEKAIKKAYEEMENISFKNMHFRKDIGRKALLVLS